VVDEDMMEILEN